MHIDWLSYLGRIFKNIRFILNGSEVLVNNPSWNGLESEFQWRFYVQVQNSWRLISGSFSMAIDIIEAFRALICWICMQSVVILRGEIDKLSYRALICWICMQSVVISLGEIVSFS